MTLIYYNPRLLDHHTGNHPEQAGRLEGITRLLDQRGLWGEGHVTAWPALEIEQAASLHQRSYLEGLADLARRGGGMGDADTVVSPASWDVALLAAGAAVDAVRRVVAGEASQGLCLVRPPGHHALVDRAMGFCLLGNVALAALTALALHQLNRVLIVDWDVHHGNGTQDFFYNNSQVGFFSAHRYPFYPGSGSADETGIGEGLGTTVNLPFALGVSRDRYLSEFARKLETFADQMKPELVLISAGFDAHRSDPVGSLGLEVEDFAYLTAAVCDVANTHAQGRVISVLEGGYNPPVLAECVATHLETLRDYAPQKS